MDIFHVIIDTSILTRTPFRSGGFDRLLLRVQQGLIKLYIPHIVVEERRSQLLSEYSKHAEAVKAALQQMQRGHMAMLLEGLPAVECVVPTREEVDRNSRSVFQRYLADNRVNVLPFTFDHASKALERYMLGAPPFNPNESRTGERKHIPDSWILEAALEIKMKPGRHCVLVDDARFESALKNAEFEVFKDLDTLDSEIETATAVVPILGINPAPPSSSQPAPLNKLRGVAFKDVDVIVLGINEALSNPSKEKLFGTLADMGIERTIAEHEARTLVLSGVLTDTGSHLVPTNTELARSAASEQVVIDLLLRVI
ncbi:PIN domain-containing protein [Lysobacter sp. Root690]|uniref:PIN domain-containing protein n=1 Tax=Lysobacter sp. Root690 TaxID=1736588 RepID=UPI000AB6B8C1|nr:PIN domain-containing protein [Lysobacter sp. Root690]